MFRKLVAGVHRLADERSAAVIQVRDDRGSRAAGGQF